MFLKYDFLISLLYSQMIHKSAVKLFVNEWNKSPHKMITLHMDATGQLVRRLDDECKYVMNQVLVMSLKTNEANRGKIMIPVGEMISEDQTSLNLQNFLQAVASEVNAVLKDKANVNLRSKPRIADYIVSDWSFANFNAIAVVSSNSFLRYMDRMFEAFEEESLEKVSQ